MCDRKSILEVTLLGGKKVLSRTLKGYLAVPIEEPFEEPFLVPDRTLLVPVEPFPQRVLIGNQKKGSTWNQKGFSYGES
jgi:hypothetical protein